MKKILRTVLIMSFGLTFLSVNAQTINVKGGLNLSNMTSKDNAATYSDDFEMLPGFHAGFTTEIPILSGFYIEPGVIFSTKGYKTDLLGVKYQYNLNYIDIPVNLKIRMSMDNFSFWGSAGPYLGVGLGGKLKIDAPIIGLTEEDIEFGEDKDFKMLDYGIGIAAGVGFSSFIVGVGYNFGLANISTITLNDHVTNNNVLSVTLGYRFRK